MHQSMGTAALYRRPGCTQPGIPSFESLKQLRGFVFGLYCLGSILAPQISKTPIRGHNIGLCSNRERERERFTVCFIVVVIRVVVSFGRPANLFLGPRKTILILVTTHVR